ncbi:MAG: radical SAM protein [Candidatus Marinimicrobia bacterium]|nr:radical SAM protein [Candidatus Neomarinimicrobiota bacterium]MDP7527024.1 radical SAM protein [Candidatus Neomarinimicrobiota bacterium]
MGINQYQRWIRHKTNNRNFINGLRFTTTWRCNSRCTTCSIWKMDDSNDLTVSEIDKFSKSKYFSKTSYITLSGGEPTLRNDLPELVTVLHKNIPSAGLNLTTNGINPERTERMFREIRKNNPDLRIDLVGLSLNGPKDIHDKTRGIPKNYEKVLETYDRIKNLVPVAFSFTFCKDNVDYFDWVQDFAEKKGTYAYICWTVMNQRFQVSDEDLLFWKPGMEKVLLRHVDRVYKNKGFLYNLAFLPAYISSSYLYDSIVNQRLMPCQAGSQIVHVAPEGDIYPCNFKLTPDRILGNIREDNFDNIWENISSEILSEIDSKTCMYPNGLCGDSDILPSIKGNPPELIKWYLAKYFKREELIQVKDR